MSQWDSWIGRTCHATDFLGTALAARWRASFDLPQSTDVTMPQGIHFCLCTPDTPTALLGDDGHPLRDGSVGSFLPPVPLPRRMWAASTIVFHRPLALGDRIERVSRIEAITPKQGASGALVFVTLDHKLNANGALALNEHQTLVYRDAASAEAALSPPLPGAGRFDPSGWDAHRLCAPDSRLLFRYSALTFNSHRIHYDASYAQEVERYRGLVVHGPLIASLLLQLASAHCGENALTRFSFRGMSPAIAGEPLHLVLREDAEAITLGAFAQDGRQITKAEAIRA